MKIVIVPAVSGLEGRRALVTGASRGIGKAIALDLAAAGCDVVGVARSPDALAAVGAEIEARSSRTVDKFVRHWAEKGFGVFAVEERETGRFLGQCGLNTIDELGEVEVLYALERAAWGRGLATEAARAALAYGFGEAGLSRIVAVTRPDHVRSRRVLEKLGLHYERDVHIFGLAAVLYSAVRP